MSSDINRLPFVMDKHCVHVSQELGRCAAYRCVTDIKVLLCFLQ